MKAIYLEEAIERYMEIVRCGDCRHKYIKDMSAYCPNRVGALRSDGYCERGERK